jgi:hypothetical protein
MAMLNNQMVSIVVTQNQGIHGDFVGVAHF